MTKSLTEKWKDGELGFGYYYIDFGIGGVPMLFNGMEFYCERTQKPNAIKTILASVPSYDEYKELQEERDYFQKTMFERNADINKLREQLKDANESLKEYARIETHDWIDSQVVAERYLKKWGVK